MTTPLHGRRRRQYTVTEIRSHVGKRFSAKSTARIDARLEREIETGQVWHAPDDWRSRYAAAMIAAGYVNPNL